MRHRGVRRGPKRVDGDTMALMSKAAAELHLRNVRMDLESTTLKKKSAKFIRSINHQTQVAKAHSIANQMASGPTGSPDEASLEDPPLTGKQKRSAERRVASKAQADTKKGA